MKNESERLQRMGTVIGFVFAFAVSLFAWDFRPTQFSLVAMLPFATYLIPAALVLTTTVIARFFPAIGGLGFLGLGIWYLSMLKQTLDWKLYVVMLGPLALLAFISFAVVGTSKRNSGESNNNVSDA